MARSRRIFDLAGSLKLSVTSAGAAVFFFFGCGGSVFEQENFVTNGGEGSLGFSA